jgi:hypothetical protein
MIYQSLCSSENTLMDLYTKNQSTETNYLLKEEVYSLNNFFHVEDGKTMLLVPRKLHKAVPHTGGAAILKGKK